MSLTYFVAALRCPVCGTLSPPDTTTRMLNDWAPDPETVIRVGIIPMPASRTCKIAFLEVHAASREQQVHILQTWHCPTCRSSNWAEVVVLGGRVISIENVALTRQSLSRAHFIVDDLYKSYEAITGQSVYVDSGVRPDFVELLARHLPA